MLALPYLELSAHDKENTIPPSPIEPKVTTAMTILLQVKGSGPAPAALFLAELVLVDANPFAALNPVAVGLYVAAVSVPVAAAEIPTLGLPVAVCVIAASFGAVVALGIGAPDLAKATTFEFVALKSV